MHSTDDHATHIHEEEKNSTGTHVPLNLEAKSMQCRASCAARAHVTMQPIFMKTDITYVPIYT